MSRDAVDGEVSFALPEGHYWGRPVARGPWCIVDRETRRTLCRTHSEPLDTRLAPDRDELPGSICEECAAAATFLAITEADAEAEAADGN